MLYAFKAKFEISEKFWVYCGIVLIFDGNIYPCDQPPLWGSCHAFKEVDHQTLAYIDILLVFAHKQPQINNLTSHNGKIWTVNTSVVVLPQHSSLCLWDQIYLWPQESLRKVLASLQSESRTVKWAKIRKKVQFLEVPLFCIKGWNQRFEKI